ncbi:MAG: hypothetical protein GXY25_15570 [Pirellulaceae bacterium]|jgi:hypothetical protein|nr:hypothetical protein [Thermoguttaceae bacterium]MDI9446576.1 hypothetical protein [Planctomycetota bacterium]NLZ01943.1 hypothetical protein [Pirellulaceae bacterium]
MFVPPWEEVGSLVGANRRTRAAACCDIQGKCLGRLAAAARTELVRAARHWTGQYRDLDAWAEQSPERVLLAGHQPQMFHPGVWLKNYALSRLAEEHHALGVNLVVDSDILWSAVLRVPGGSPAEPRVANIPFDAPGLAVPFEERGILQPEVFASFADRVAEQLADLVKDPLVGSYWRLVRRRAADGHRLGACLAQARHAIEGAWGWRTLEVPQSAVCDTSAYRWFLCHLLDELPRFQRDYNEVVRQYRAIHRIRSAAHPVPDLAEQDGWLEAPFWVWQAGDPRRQRLFARRVGNAVLLTDRRGLEIALPLAPGGDPLRAVDALDDWAAKGVRIRSRALITTLWARLALGDLFVHGIGGAKYDQVADALIWRFFRVAPPGFFIVSGTLHLPVHRPADRGQVSRRIRQELRRLEFQPERYLDQVHPAVPADARRLAEEKRAWVFREVAGESRRQRFLAIRGLNRELRRWVAPRAACLRRELDIAEQSARASAILTSRDYGFCLYPAATLHDFFTGLLPKRV